MMKCPTCGVENTANATHCTACGDNMYSGASRSLDKAGAVALIIIFFPVGLCGLFFTAGAISQITYADGDTSYAFGFGGFAAICLLTGGYLVCRSIITLIRK